MPDLLTLYAQAQPDKVAVVDDRPDGTVTTLSFAELNARANRLANVLVGLDARPGATKIVWCGQNSVGLVAIINAARKLGVTAVPLNYRLSDEEAMYVTDHCDASIVYVDAEFASTFARIRAKIPQVKHILVFDGATPDGMIDADELMAAASPDEPEIASSTEAGATMIYTSGTTGKPKGAFRPGSASPDQAGALVALIGYTPDDVYIPTGPLYHSGPLGFMGIAQALGQTVVLQRKFAPEDWLRLVTKYRVSSTFSAPTPIRMICALPDEVKAHYDTSSMKRMIANAAPWSFALKLMYLENFPAESLFEVYGSTELSVNTILMPDDQLRKPGSCGQAAPLVEIELFDDDGNEVTGTGPDHPGELFVKSASVFADYYKEHDKYEADQKHGYQTVGDIAYRDDEGFYYICDRKKDMIISGGMNIYPAEIEAALEAHPDIYEAAVFGIPDDEWGEAVHAVVVQREGAGLTEADLTAHAREKLAGYKVPRSITWSDELPKTGSGKLLKRELRRAVLGRPGQQGLMRSGFITFVGRPNVGKSTLLNAVCGQKVSIVSDKPQTTRTRVRGIVNRPDAQLVFVDTPGLHKPVTALGRRVNATALESAQDVDVVCLVIDATMPFGSGDQWVAGRINASKAVVVVNKIDAASKQSVLKQLVKAGSLDASAYFPVSAKTGAGVDELVDHLSLLLPEGPMYFPVETVSDQPEEQWIAELVREQLLAVFGDELPYSIATRVTEWEGPRIRVEIIVERESQKGMVIGKHGAVLKDVGTRARAQLPEGVYLELFVKVDKDWQQRADRVERLGY